MVRTLQTQAQAKEQADAEEKLRKRAARQAAKSVSKPADIQSVECTILPMGDGKVSMGEHVAGLGEAHYEEGETLTLELPVALSLFERGFVNFAGAREALNERNASRAAAARARADRLEEARAKALEEEAMATL